MIVHRTDAWNRDSPLLGDSHTKSVRIVPFETSSPLKSGASPKWIINRCQLNRRNSNWILADDDKEGWEWKKARRAEQRQCCRWSPSTATTTLSHAVPSSLLDYKHEITTRHLSLPVSWFVCARINTCLCVCVFPWEEVTLQTGRCWRSLCFPNTVPTQEMMWLLWDDIMETGSYRLSENKQSNCFIL